MVGAVEVVPRARGDERGGYRTRTPERQACADWLRYLHTFAQPVLVRIARYPTDYERYSNGTFRDRGHVRSHIELAERGRVYDVYERSACRNRDDSPKERDKLGDLGDDFCHWLFCRAQAASRGQQGTNFPESFIRCPMHNGHQPVTGKERRELFVGDAL